MVKFYGSHICSGCREALELFEKEGFREFEFVEITENVQNLREFLALRDNRPELAAAKAEGRICIPCFLLEDGSILTEPEDLMKA